MPGTESDTLSPSILICELGPVRFHQALPHRPASNRPGSGARGAASCGHLPLSRLAGSQVQRPLHRRLQWRCRCGNPALRAEAGQVGPNRADGLSPRPCARPIRNHLKMKLTKIAEEDRMTFPNSGSAVTATQQQEGEGRCAPGGGTVATVYPQEALRARFPRPQ